MHARKPKALVLSFFPAISPPANGGEARLGGLYRELSRHYDITLLTTAEPAAPFEEIFHAPAFRELRIPRDDFWRNAQATLDVSGVHGDVRGLAFALAVSDPACVFRTRARELAETADVVIHDSP